MMNYLTFSPHYLRAAARFEAADRSGSVSRIFHLNSQQNACLPDTRDTVYQKNALKNSNNSNNFANELTFKTF